MNGEEFHSGFVTVIGKPNVGKSTLVNNMIGEKIAIVSSKPQTTRNRIMGVLTQEKDQIVFLDTPGIHTPRNKLGEYMMYTVKDAMEGMDCLMVLIDSSHVDSKDREIISSINNKKVYKVLVLNKTDLVPPTRILELTGEFAASGFDDIVPVSAKTGDGMDELKKALISHLPLGPHYFPDDMITDQPERNICAEIIREKALLNLRDEVPHGIGVEIMGMENQGDNFTEINATVYCEREAHKAIIIGKNGSMLKKIGTESRKDIENLLDLHVNLKLWVKVRNDWRNKSSDLINLGYDKRQ